MSANMKPLPLYSTFQNEIRSIEGRPHPRSPLPTPRGGLALAFGSSYFCFRGQIACGPSHNLYLSPVKYTDMTEFPLPKTVS